MDAYADYIATMTAAELIAERDNMARCIVAASHCGTEADVRRLNQKRIMVCRRMAALTEGHRV